MSNKFSKLRRGFSLIEIMVIVAIVMIMTGALFVTTGKNKRAATDLDTASRQVEAQLRALQNESLNGKVIGGVNVCKYQFDTFGSSYAISYYRCDGSTTPLDVQTTDLTSKRISFDTESLFFSPPQGDVNAEKIIMLKAPAVDPVACATISVSINGNITTEKNVDCF